MGHFQNWTSLILDQFNTLDQDIFNNWTRMKVLVYVC
jgi:hypothetical protein